MKYTKEQLQAMSNDQINRALDSLVGVYYDDFAKRHLPLNDYCNEPNDIMPLAFEHQVGLQPARNQWQAFAETSDFYDDTNPLRAIACCLILVLQERNS